MDNQSCYDLTLECPVSDHFLMSYRQAYQFNENSNGNQPVGNVNTVRRNVNIIFTI